MGPNTSIMDSSKHAMSKSEFVDDQSVATGNYDYKVSINKIKSVFKVLMEETPFLVDDKALQECQGKTIKEEFTIKIDSIRKSLGIDNMDDVELLVQTFYEFSDRNKQEAMMSSQMGADMDDHNHNSNNHNSNQDLKKQQTKRTGDARSQQDDGEGSAMREDDDESLAIDMDEVVDILKDFHKKREERANN